MNANSGRWRPGQSGNPLGRPRGFTLSTALRQLSQEPSEADPATSNVEALAKVIVREALAGDVKFTQIWIERLEGRAPLVVDYQPEAPQSSPEEKERFDRAAKSFLSILGGGEPDENDFEPSA